MDELFAIVPIAKDVAAYDSTLYTADVDYLITRARAYGSVPFQWDMPDGNVIGTFYPAGEVLELTPDSMLIKWRDLPWGSGEVFQCAAFLLDDLGLKIKWGNFAESVAGAILPYLDPGEPCNDTNVICYDHEKKEGF